MQSIFDSKEIAGAVRQHKGEIYLTVGAWIGVMGVVAYCLTEYTKPEQRVFGPYVIIVTLECIANYFMSKGILSKVEEMRERESEGEDVKALAQEFKDFNWHTFVRKSCVGFTYFLAVGLATPPMLKEAFAGDMPWSEVAEYMLFLAFLGTISGMVIMSMNAPFIVHTVSYTFSGVFLLVLGCYEHSVHKGIEKWAEKIQNDSIPFKVAFVPVVQVQQETEV